MSQKKPTSTAPQTALQIPEWVVKLAASNSVPPANILKEYNDTKMKMVEEHTEGDVATLAKYAIMGKYRKPPVVKRKKKESKYRDATIIGFKIGDIGMVDRAQRMREWAELTVNQKGLEYARKNGLVTVQEGKVLVLDNRDKIFGRENKNKGTPLDPKLKLRDRTIIMLAKEPDDKQFMYTRLQTNDNKLAPAWGQLPFNTMVTAPIKIGRKDNAGILASSMYVEGKPDMQTVFRQVKDKVDFFKTFEETMGQDITPLEDITKYHLATEKNWERYIVLNGVVASLALDNPGYRGVMCVLMDKELGFEGEQQVKFYVPDHLRINFGQFSEVYVIGKTKGSYEESETEKDEKGKPKKILIEVTVDAWGVIPVPGKTTPTTAKSLLEEGAEEQIEGFVPL